MLWFGGREIGTWLYIAWATFSMMVVYTVEAVRNAPRPLSTTRGRSGPSRAHVFRTVSCPLSCPR